MWHPWDGIEDKSLSYQLMICNIATYITQWEINNVCLQDKIDKMLQIRVVIISVALSFGKCFDDVLITNISCQWHHMLSHDTTLTPAA